MKRIVFSGGDLRAFDLRVEGTREGHPIELTLFKVRLTAERDSGFSFTAQAVTPWRPKEPK